MRITSNITADNSLYNIQQGRAKLDKLQVLIASGQNVNTPSDDPITTRLLLDIGEDLKTGDQYTSNITKSTTFLQTTSTALQGMTDILQLAKKLVGTISDGSSVNGSSDAQSRRQDVVTQLQTLRQQLADMGNTRFGNQYVFGGTANTKPFVANAAYNSSNPATFPSFNYLGDGNPLNVEIASGSSPVQINVTGDQVLGGSAVAPSKYGTTDIIKTFDNLINDVQGDGVAGSANQYGNLAGIQAGAQALESGYDQVNSALSDVTYTIMRLDNVQKLNTNSKNTLETIVGNTQNVDYAKLAVQLTQQQTAFQASLSATAKVTQLSLLDYMK